LGIIPLDPAHVGSYELFNLATLAHVKIWARGPPNMLARTGVWEPWEGIYCPETNTADRESVIRDLQYFRIALRP